MEGETHSIFKALDRLISKLKDFVVCTTGACGVEREVDDWAFKRMKTVVHFRPSPGRTKPGEDVVEMFSFAMEKWPAFAVIFLYEGEGGERVSGMCDQWGIKHKIIELKE